VAAAGRISQVARGGSSHLMHQSSCCRSRPPCHRGGSDLAGLHQSGPGLPTRSTRMRRSRWSTVAGKCLAGQLPQASSW